MKFIKKKKKLNDPIKLINECITSLDEVKKKLYNGEKINIDAYSVADLDEYAEWGSSFKLKDFVR